MGDLPFDNSARGRGLPFGVDCQSAAWPMECTMRLNEWRFLVNSDLYRYAGKTSLLIFLEHIVLTPGFKYTFLMRTCAYLDQYRILRYSLFPLVLILLWHYKYKFGIDIPYKTKIGSGFYIGHFGGIVVHQEAVIGRNCNIPQGVTIGVSNRGDRKGIPFIGHSVFIGPGAKIFGRVVVCDNAAIGANSVVTSDVPERAVVVGIPARVISHTGSDGYINEIDY